MKIVFKKYICLLPFAFCLLLSGCGSAYKVKPAVNAPLPDEAKSNSTSLYSLRATALFTDEESQDLFETNLPLAGVLPVRVEFENKSGAPVDLKKVRFIIGDAGGKNWKNLSAKDTVKRVYKANKIFAYTPASRKEFLEGVQTHALNVDLPLVQGEKRAGVLFFQTPNKEPVEKPQGLILRVEKLAEVIELRLN